MIIKKIDFWTLSHRRIKNMNKKQKLIYLTNDAINKLELLKKINGFDNSKVIEILLKKQKKLNLI